MSKLLYAKSQGAGPTIVLIHGFLTSSQYFSHLAAQLSADFTVISIDLLGHGKSTKKGTDFSLEAQVTAIHKTLDKLQVKKPFTILGHSLGTLVALEYVQKHQPDVNKLILLNPSMFNHPDQAYASIVGTSPIYKSFLFSKLRAPLWQTMRVVPPLPKAPISSRDRARVPTKARDDSLQMIIDTNFFELIESICTPTLVVIGAKDRKAYHDNIASWLTPKHVKLSHNASGHHYLKSEPAKAHREIKQFLES